MTMPAWPFALVHPTGYTDGIVPTGAELQLLQQQSAASADGRVWTDVGGIKNYKWFDGTTAFAAPNLDQIVRDPVSKRWLMFGEISSNAIMLWTLSGAQWHTISPITAATTFVGQTRAAVSSAGVIVAGGSTGSASASKVTRSTNGGATWAAQTLGSVDVQTMQDIAYSETLGLWFCSVGQIGFAGAFIYTSPDGITWTSRFGSSPRKFVVRDSPSAVILGVHLQTITTPNNTNYARTVDGITWTSETFPEAMAGGSAGGCWSNALGLFVQQGVSGVWTSPTGLTGSWTKVSTNNPGGPIGAFGRLLVRGDGSMSADGGATWSPMVECDPTYSNPSWFDLCATPYGIALWRGASREVFLSIQTGF